MTAEKMSSKPQNSISDKLQQDFRALYIKILGKLEKDQLKELRYFYFGTPETYDLLSIEHAGKISWTDVSSLQEGLSAVGREDLADTLEEFEIKRNFALLLDAFARIRKGIPRQNLFKYIEAIAWYLAKLTDDALDKNKFKVKSLRKSKKSIEEVMISLKEKIETNLTEPWTKRLALLTVIAGELLSETETKNDFASSLPKAVMRCSAEICSGMTSLDEWSAFCCYVEERYSELYCEHDRSAMDVKKNADDIIDTLTRTCLCHEPGNASCR